MKLKLFKSKGKKSKTYQKMPSYKLTYFDARGRAEISRLIFAAAGVEYTDERVKDWPAGKDRKTEN